MKRSHVVYTATAALMLLGCTPPKTVRGATIASRPAATQLPAVPKHKQLPTTQDNQQLLQQLQQLNQQAKTPSFALIGAFYQLPVTHPGGALLLEQDIKTDNWSSQQRLVALQGQHPYAVLPLNTQQAQSLEASMQQILDAKIQLLQLSTADALAVMRAEQQALLQQSKKQTNILPWSTTLPPNVNFLISIQAGQGRSGPTLVGRVIDTHNGKLMALRSKPNAGGNSLGDLLLQLLHDTLRRVVQPPTKQPLQQKSITLRHVAQPPAKQPPQQAFICPCTKPVQKTAQ
ncbi:MAG: hypothetical protein AAF310_01160 [Myxococcota bacterium]